MSVLAAALHPLPAGKLAVGFSGGLDSTVLLHALAASTDARSQGLRALHVHHGLHADADAWAAHCEAVCTQLDVPLQVLRVQVDHGSGRGPEGAARAARLQAFRTALDADETLALAHHRDDQAETVLLRLCEALEAMAWARCVGARGSAPCICGGHCSSCLALHCTRTQRLER